MNCDIKTTCHDGKPPEFSESKGAGASAVARDEYTRRLLVYLVEVRALLHVRGVDELDTNFPIREQTVDDAHMCAGHTAYGYCHMTHQQPVPVSSCALERQVCQNSRAEFLTIKVHKTPHPEEFRPYPPQSLLATLLHELAHAATPGTLVFVDDERRCVTQSHLSGKGRDPKGSKALCTGNSGQGRRGGQRGRHRDASKDKSGNSRFFPSQQELKSGRRNVWVQEVHSAEFYTQYARLLRLAQAEDIIGLGGKTANMYTLRSLERFDRLDNYTYPMPLSQAPQLAEARARVMRAYEQATPKPDREAVLRYVAMPEMPEALDVDQDRLVLYRRRTARVAAHNLALAYAVASGQIPASKECALPFETAVFLHVCPPVKAAPGPAADVPVALQSDPTRATDVHATASPQHSQAAIFATVTDSDSKHALRVTLTLANGRNRGRKRALLLQERSEQALLDAARAKLRLSRKENITLKSCALSGEQEKCLTFEDLQRATGTLAVVVHVG